MSQNPVSESKATRPRVLCVDDEPRVLEGMRTTLGRRFSVVTAESAVEALGITKSEEPFAVVISDMRMPKVDGARFLRKMYEIAPDTVRLLLTGQSDIESAIAAINHGRIFRFLTKPCAPDRLVEIVSEAFEQHRLIIAEQELLEKTLRGSVQVLMDLLSHAAPTAFGRANRIKQRALSLAEATEVQVEWSFEVAALMSQIGAITLSMDTSEKLYLGQELTLEEQLVASGLPSVAADLIAKIPRFEPVVEILRACDPKSGSSPSEEVTSKAALIMMAQDLDVLEAQGLDTEMAVAVLKGRDDKKYPPAALAALVRNIDAGGTKLTLLEVPVTDLRPGMVLASDLRLKTGVLLVARGSDVTPTLVQKLGNFEPNEFKGPVRVSQPTQ